MDGVELGQLLRAERTAAGRTIASVAVAAGLSVPYIANLENGRGNPTLSALRRLADALGVHLDIALTPSERPVQPSAELSTAVVRFSRTTRFQAEVRALAAQTSTGEAEVRSRFLAVLGAAQAATPHELSVVDCHRLLDAMVLTLRPLPG